MAARIIGALLLAAGAILGLKFVGVIATGVLGFAALLLKAGLVAAIIWLGWTWINRPSALLKVVGAFVMVGGMLLAIPLFGLLLVETVALLGLAGKVVVVAVLLYMGWQLLNRDPQFTQRT